MKIIQKLAGNSKQHEGVTIAFLGDSVTQGCFEVYKNGDGRIEPVCDPQSAYEMGVLRILGTLFPATPVNVINAGISGNHAPAGLARIDRDVIRHAPDLTVVCFGLNDCKGNDDSIERYTAALEGIFLRLKEAGTEILFMTPNMMNTTVSPQLSDPDLIAIAENCAAAQNNGTFDAHIEAAKALCKKHAVPVCDCYSIWKTLWESGVNTTELLSNKINHPTREMNKLFAIELVRTMFTEE